MDQVFFNTTGDAGQRIGFWSFARTALAIGAIACMASVSEARITRIQIVSVQSPTFGALSFGSVGQYEKICAIAYGEVDPADRRNALITDINLAPKNANGKIEYNVDVHILKPIDMSKGNGRILYDVVNRGNDLLIGPMNGAGGNNPTTAADAGTGLMMRLGYTHVVSGWEDDGPRRSRQQPRARQAAHRPQSGRQPGRSEDHHRADLRRPDRLDVSAHLHRGEPRQEPGLHAGP